MADGEAGGDTTYTQDEVDALIAERNKALEANRDKALAETKAAKEALRAFGDLDAETVKQSLAELAELKQQRHAEASGITSEQLEKLRVTIRQDLEQEYEPLKTQVVELSTDNRTLRLDSKVQTLMAENGVLPHRIEALYSLEGKAFDLTDDGSPMLRDNPGGDLGKFITENLAQKYPEWFEGSGSSRGGAAKSEASGRGRRGSIAANDPDSFMDNLEDIAKGTVTVRE